MLFRTQQEAEGGLGIDPHQNGIVRLEDLIEEADDDGGEVVLLVDPPGLSNGAVHDVVHGPQGDPKIEDVAQQFDHAAGRAMADEHQGQDQLPQPRLGNRQVEEDLLGSQNRGEGTVERLLRGVHLLVEELPADVVLAGQLGDCFRPGEHLDGQVSPLLRRQLLGRTRNMNSCRSWPVKRSRSGSGITLRDRDGQSSLTIHVCFLRETVLVGTNHPNMEETGSLENPIPSGKCYLDLNRAHVLPITPEEQARDARAIAAFVERMLAMPDEDPPRAWEEAMRDLDAQRPHRKLFEGLY